MPIDPARLPVLVGLGEAIERDAVTTPVELAARAAEAAFAEAPGLRESVQRLSLVAVSFSPIGAAAGTEIARALSLQGVDCEATTPGGNTPQWLINRACSQIVAGELESTLIVGAEATRSMRLADPGRDFLRAATTVPEEEGPRDPVVGVSIRGMLSQAEIEAGLMRPADVYPVFENALSDRLGHDASQARARIVWMTSAITASRTASVSVEARGTMPIGGTSTFTGPTGGGESLPPRDRMRASSSRAAS